MEAIGGAALRRVAMGPGFRRGRGDGGEGSLSRVGVWGKPRRVSVGGGFSDKGHLKYYVSPARCGGEKKKEKKKVKLVKELSRDLLEFSSMGFGVGNEDGMVAEVKGKMISEAADLLLSQLNQLRAESKEMKRRRKQEKAAMKAAMKAARMKDTMNDTSSSSSSESSDGECEAVVKVSSIRALENLTYDKPSSCPDSISPKAENGMEEVAAENNMTLKKIEQDCRSSWRDAAIVVERPMDNKIEVCMGGKCKKSGALELMEELEKKVGIEGAVVGCKCMGKCRNGPNVRVVDQSSSAMEKDGVVKVAKNPLCIGVGLEDVGSIVANFFGEKRDDLGGLVPAA